MSERPIGFMSYVRFDDEHEHGRLTEFCKRLSGEVRIQTGEEFQIFQDKKHIAWGQQWQRRIDESLDAVTFLIPIITPGFFKSQACRAELERFIDREKKLGLGDLILPVYYVDCPILNDEKKCEADPLAKIIAGREYADWRELRFEPFTSPQVGKTLARMAAQIVEALERANPVQPPPPVSFDDPSPQLSQNALTMDTTRDAVAEQTSGGARYPSKKTEPPTLVVDAGHPGNYSSLTDALQAAQPGDRILVRPGLYREGIVIDKPVEIIGDGKLGDVVIEAVGKNAVLFRAGMGRIANLSMVQAGGGEWCCIDIAQGRLDVEGCDISSSSHACVSIHGGADPRLRLNRIHDGKYAGVFIEDNGRGTLEDNEIFGNGLSGVEIRTRGNPTLRRNRIHDGKSAGVLVYDNGQGTLEDNDILGSAFAGVEIRTGGNPILRRNRIRDGKSDGVFVQDNGLGTLEDNEIFGNVLAGVEIKTGGNPIVRRNRIRDGKSDGVFVQDNGMGTLEDNEIFGNALSGVEIKSGGNPTLRRNRIQDGKSAGVFVWENGQGTLEDNEIFENALAGVGIASGGSPILRRNRIHDGKQGGAMVYDNGLGTLEDNEIFGNAFTGVEIRSGGNPILRRNRIHDGKYSSVLIYENGQGTLEDNEIFGNASVGVEIKTGGNPVLRRNRITNNTYQAIWVYEGGKGTFEENDLRGNAKGAWEISPDCLANVTRTRNQE